MIKSVTRHREFTGPTPHSVAIVSYFISTYNKQQKSIPNN